MLRRLIPTCFGCTKPSPQGINHESVTKYETHFGQIIVTWSRIGKAVSINTQIFVSCGPNKGRRVLNHQINTANEGQRGTRRFNIKQSASDPCHVIEVAWDLSRAQFRMRGDAKPNENFFFCIVAQGEVIVLQGDLHDEAHRQFRRAENWTEETTYSPFMRQDTVDLKGRPYGSAVQLGGKKREISISIERNKYAAMKVVLDGESLVELTSIWSEDRGAKEYHSAQEVIKVEWRRAGWTKALSKKKIFGAERETTGAILPRIIVGISCTKRAESVWSPRKSAVFFRLVSE